MALPERWLSVDPGEDTGWAVWSGNEFVDHGTDKLWDFADMLWRGHFDARPEPPDRLAEPTEADDAYLAGLMDGEAWVGITHKNVDSKTGCAVVRIAMCTPDPLHWAQAHYGGNVNGPYVKEGRKDMYEWKLGKQAEIFYALDRVLPFLQVKREAALQNLRHLEKTRFGKQTVRVSMVVCEDWRLYPWVLKTGALDFDECRTARLIGAIYQYCRTYNIPFETQGAKIKEAAIAAGAETYFSRPLRENRHANDATMHGVYRIAQEAAS